MSDHLSYPPRVWFCLCRLQASTRHGSVLSLSSRHVVSQAFDRNVYPRAAESRPVEARITCLDDVDPPLILTRGCFVLPLVHSCPTNDMESPGSCTRVVVNHPSSRKVAVTSVGLPKILTARLAKESSAHPSRNIVPLLDCQDAIVTSRPRELLVARSALWRCCWG